MADKCAYLRSEAVNTLIQKTDRPLLLICNGPSMADVEYVRIPDNPVIIRLNFFFLETEYYFGKHIDAFFWSIFNDVLQDRLYCLLQIGAYEIESFFCPMPLINQRRKKRLNIDKIHDAFFQPRYDHWKILSGEPSLARLMMSRPIPTTGLQALATSLALGFQEIHILGMDFYQSQKTRYAFNIPLQIKKNLPARHFTPGYEQRAHSFDTDLHAWDIIRKSFPYANIFSLSPNSYLANLTDVSSKQEKANYLFIEKKLIDKSSAHTKNNETKVLSLRKFILKRLCGSIGLVPKNKND